MVNSWMCVRSPFPETGDTINTEHKRKLERNIFNLPHRDLLSRRPRFGPVQLIESGCNLIAIY
jgi:hypothetical protein